MIFLKNLVVSTLFIAVAVPYAFGTEFFAQERSLKRVKSDANEIQRENVEGVSKETVDPKPRTCREKNNHFFARQNARSNPSPDLVKYMHELGEQERDSLQRLFPDIQFVIKGREDISRTILEAFYNAWTPAWAKRTSDAQFEFVDDTEGRRQFSLARDIRFFDTIGQENITLKAISYWFPSLKWQNTIEQFIDVGWFKLARESQNNCYWELISVGTVGVHKHYWSF